MQLSGSQRAQWDIWLPRGKNCCGTIFAPVLPLNYPHHEGILGTIWGTIFCPQIAYFQRSNLFKGFQGFSRLLLPFSRKRFLTAVFYAATLTHCMPHRSKLSPPTRCQSDAKRSSIDCSCLNEYLCGKTCYRRTFFREYPPFKRITYIFEILKMNKT